MSDTVKAAWIGFAATILAALIAGGFALYTAGKKANEASDRPVTILANFEAGFTLINPSKPASDSFHQAPAVTLPTANEEPVPKPVSTSPTSISVPTEAIKNGTCSGLDNKTWAIQIAPVTILKSKDAANHELSGYNVNLRLSNISDRSLYLKHGQAELTDDQGNELPLSSSSLPLDNLSAPTEVSGGADLPVNLKFLGPGETGKSVSFSINLHIFTQDDKPRLDKYETLACTNMPL
jgi:archaellum component FlaG (FlaF/FlaG flagellin family)